MPSRRAFLSALTAATTAGVAGCAGRTSDVFSDEPPVKGPCDDTLSQWPTAGGDPGRTGWTDTAPPHPEAQIVNALTGTRNDGRQRLASSLPVIADGTAYLPASGGIVALDYNAPTEDPLWIHDLDDDASAVPAFACGVVLVPSLNKLTALDPATGETYWQADVGGHGETTVAALDETVYVAGVTPTALDIRTGDVKWNASGGDTLALDTDGVYTTENVNGTGGIFAHDLDGEERWHLALGKIVGSASVHDGTVFVADNSGTVYAIDAATGETYWSRSLDGVSKVHLGLTVHGQDLVVTAGTGERSVVLDAASGETRWSTETGIVTGRPLIGDDWVAFGRTNIGVSIYDRQTGDRQATWSRETYDLGTIGGLVPVEDGFIVRENTTSGLSLIQ